jgi:hypothetical protein
MIQLYVIRVEHSQTDHDFIGTYAANYHDAEKAVRAKYPNAYYCSFAARVDRMLE